MTFPNFDAITPERSLVWLNLDTQYRQDVGENLLVNGDFTSGTTGWGTNDSTLSVLIGVDPEGGNALRVTSIAATFWATQIVVEAGKEYSLAGWARSDGAANISIFDGAN